MEAVTVTDDFSVEIPPSVREALSLSPGQRLVAIARWTHLTLVPQIELEDARGMLAGADPLGYRERPEG